MEKRHFSSLYPEDARSEEVETLLNYVKTGSSSQVVGMQGVGKSIFLGLLSYNKKVRQKHLGDRADKYHFVLVDFTELKRAKDADVVKALYFALAASLEERGYSKETEFVKKAFSSAVDDAFLLFQDFKKVLDFLILERELIVVFFLDSFEVYAPAVTPQFFDNLRSLQDRYRYQFSFVFSSSRPIEQLVEVSLVPVVQRALSDHILYLPVYDGPGFAFLLSYLQDHFQKTISKDVVSRIKTATYGHAKLTKVLVEEMLVGHVEEGDIENAYQDEAIVVVNREIWNELFPREQIFLRKVVKGTDLPAMLRIAMQAGGEIVDFLVKIGILDLEKQFTIPFFAAFVKKQEDALPHDSFVFRPETGEILKDDVVVSDLLTKHEYKLLRYFLEHPELVVTRDDLARATWGEEKLIQGISDESIDQLVFRLRKKIEENPNNPHHFLTLKGRGFILHTARDHKFEI